MTDQSVSEREYCVFGIGDREYLLPKESIHEIIDIKRIFPIPGSPDHLIGVIPSKGKIIHAIDLAKVFNVERLDYSDSKLIVLNIKGEKIGILSDITPFFIKIDSNIVVEDLIEPEKLLEDLSKKNLSTEQSSKDNP